MFRPLAAAAAIVLAFGAGAYAQTGKVTVVTSFSKDVTDPLQEGVREGLSGRRRSMCRTATPMPAVQLHRGDEEQQPGRPHLGVRARRLRGAEEQEAAAGLQAQGDRHSPRRSAPIRSTTRRAIYFGLRRLRLRHHVERALCQGKQACPSRRNGRTSPSRPISTMCRSPRPRARAPRI